MRALKFRVIDNQYVGTQYMNHNFGIKHIVPISSVYVLYIITITYMCITKTHRGR